MATGTASRMVQRQIEGRGIHDPRVLTAMRKIDREAFLPVVMREFAYEDSALPIEEGQTISQPYIVARMVEAARLNPADRVLEIGAGSGYAAAVMAELAMRVYTIERHPALARLAETRLHAMGYGNVDVRTGDGTLGWPEAAPFDAIVIAASGPRVPEALKEQLAVGGRLVMPVGRTPNQQELIRLTRTSEDDFDTEMLDEVMFVPLIGEQGWDAETARDRKKRTDPAEHHRRELRSLPGLIKQAARRLPEPEDESFADAFERFADRRVVLLGEASHGTSEFYRARAAITRRLVEKHGFGIVAVEADWPDALALDRFTRGLPTSEPGRPIFRRFPTWMWRNTDVDAFVGWLRRHNARLSAERRAGFYGLDIYSLSDSIEAVLAYLDKTDPEAAKVARERYGCLTPWQRDPAVYGRAVLSRGYHACEPAVVAALTDLLNKRLEYAAEDNERFFDAAQNAHLVAAAERYYRIMYYGGAESWNLRDRHMFDTLTRLLEHRGPHARAVVWAHNSHIGDARFTNMGRVRDEFNLGQLCRERFGNEAAMIGFGTHSGTVAAASDWDEAMEVMRLQPSRPDSVERLFHDSAIERGVLMLDHDADLQNRLAEERLERFIGVIYRPDTELQSHYAGVDLSRQFDAYVWFDQTRAVEPLPAAQREGIPDTWPFGV
jgi:protein-L-isoaspartate(D-aspartate) O-methyltransferase